MRLRAVLAAVAAGLLLAVASPASAQQGTGAAAHAVEPDAGAAGEVVHQLAEAAASEGRRVQRGMRSTPAPEAAPAALTDQEVTAIARTSGRIGDWIADHPISRSAAEFDADKREWTVFFVSEDEDGAESTEAQAIISDDTGEITEVRTGPQVAWMMARGYDGAFGRAINRPVIWLALCALFLIPLLPLHRPLRVAAWRTMDLLAILSFSASLYWFNEGEIFTSVPLQYPPMVYLALRMTWIGVERARRARRPADPTAPPGGPRAPGFPGWAPTWVLATILIVCCALRFGLNAFDSNVIDVGYAGVIGADRIANGSTPYGTMPDDCGSCDTYGPLNYIAYVPFEVAQPWTGSWDALPAAHGAATMFDLLCIAGMFLLGWRVAGVRLGMALGTAWAACPWTAYALATNSNDSLVAATLIWGLVAIHRPVLRGFALGLALGTKFAPAVLLPLWSRRPFPRPGGRAQLLPFAAGLALAAVTTGWVLFLDGTDGIRAFWSRTVGYQMERDSPFSLWGQHAGLRPVQIGLMVLVAAGGLALWRWPRRLDLVSVTAFSGALIIGMELTVTHWFYLYIPWFLPFVLLATVPEWPAPRPVAADAPPAGDESGAGPPGPDLDPDPAESRAAAAS